MNIISDRERLTDEIVPVRAEQSRTKNFDEKNYRAHYAIDRIFTTYSHTYRGSEGDSWFKLILDQLYCVNQVVWYDELGKSKVPFQTWTCSPTDCSACEGATCSFISVTIYSEETLPDTTTGYNDGAGCKYGDIVKVQNKNHLEDEAFRLNEIAITGKQGEWNILS